MDNQRDSRLVTLTELSPLLEEILRQGGEARFVPHGNSMRPLLRGGRDAVVLRRPDGPLKKGDCPLYRRADGSFVLHRVVAIRPDGYALRGDSQQAVEYGVGDDQVRAVLVAVERDGRLLPCRSARYRLYCRLLPLLRLCRRAAGKLRQRREAR